MLCKLSFQNMKKSIKDYVIYFLTLVFGVAIFYMFNSLDGQTAMLKLTADSREIVEMLVDMLGYVSVFVAVVLGFLIIYANNFLIKRRKKEFGIYMTLGMGKRSISMIILLETVLVGLFSLVVGLFVGVFGSQLMSVFTAKMFMMDMSGYTFVFSQSACVKTCLYFAVMYVAVLLFNTVTVSRYKLIDLLTSGKKNEKVIMRNPIVSVLVFLAAVAGLSYAYYHVTAGAGQISRGRDFMQYIVIGIAATFMIFWSLSGFLLSLVRKVKGTYYKGTNMFVLRQINSGINTTVVSMSIICLMLFVTISALSVSISLKNTFQKSVEETAPVDVNILKYKTQEGQDEIVDCSGSLEEDLKKAGFDTSKLKDITEITLYAVPGLTWETFLGDTIEQARQINPNLYYEATEELIKLSDYNRIARQFGEPEYELAEDEYIALCDFKSMKNLRDAAIAIDHNPLEIAGKTYHSKYEECMEGYVQISAAHTNTGIIIVPDSCALDDSVWDATCLSANYNVSDQDARYELDHEFDNGSFWKKLDETYADKADFMTYTRDGMYTASMGLSGMGVFLAIYTGVVFLIASAAILSLKQLSDSADNVERYTILRKIGCDEKMLSSALFRQVGIFFGLPLLLAIIHSVFGIQFGMFMMSGIVESSQLLPSVVATAVIIAVIYGAYFIATYLECKSIIRERA